jgi:hypothetical protein
LEVVKALASFSANVKAPTADGTTCVSIAAGSGHFEVERTLAALRRATSNVTNTVRACLCRDVMRSGL